LEAARRSRRAWRPGLAGRPADFWGATPADLRNALGLDEPGDGAPATSDLLRQLMEAFPDDRQ
jgi:hypothetical protein